MLNILKTLTDYLLKMEEGEEESCAIPDESIDDWYQQVNDKLEMLRKDPELHKIRIEQLEEISEHLKKVKAIRDQKCHSGESHA